MSSLLESTMDLTDVFLGKMADFTKEIDDVHMIWLEEIGQAAQKMFSSDFNTEPELMPKTPSQKKSNRRRRVSVGLGETRATRRLSKGRRSNLRRSSAHQTLNPIPESLVAPIELDADPDASDSKPQRKTRRNNTKPNTRSKPPTASAAPLVDDVFDEEGEAPAKAMETEPPSSAEPPQVSSSLPSVSETEEVDGAQADPAPVSETGIVVVPETPPGPARTSVRRSTASRRSLAGLRRSLTQEAVRRASRRSFLKKKARLSRSACSSVNDDICIDSDGVEVEEIQREEKVGDVEEPAVSVSPAPEDKAVGTEMDASKEKEGQKTEVSSEVSTRYTRSMARTNATPTGPAPASFIVKPQTPVSAADDGKKAAGTQSVSRFGFKRRVDSTAEEAPQKKASPKISQSVVKPHMKSFIHTVQKNQMLMMTPGSVGRTSVMSFIKHSTPGRVDAKERERLKLEAFNKKSEQENERKKRMEEERKRKHDELKKQRDERVKRVLEARERGEKEEMEKRKKLEQKMAQLLEKDKAKKTVASKRQQELELRRKQEEEAKKKKLQQLELKREQERELERKAAAERERQEREKALALRMEVERAAQEKERRELEERRKREEERRQAEEERRRAEEERRRAEEAWRRAEEEERRRAAAAAAAAAKEAQLKATPSKATTLLNTTINKGAALNVTVDLESTVNKTPVSKGAALFNMSQKNTAMNVTIDIEKSPQSYEITPKGKKITTLVNPEDYGMDQNSDDSTDDESAPKKPIPSWAEGSQLQQAIMKQYYDPVDLLSYFGHVEMPKLETIFNKSKPRFFKRTSSAVWHSPPRMGSLAH
ncbi:hypothetical protein ACEWY4_010492 [Coilia grayii]|uniref:Inner centromere protein n=1 Tax=Coilia grayii TaxID=363190 RepID=A0ABD1K242_9TELE